MVVAGSRDINVRNINFTGLRSDGIEMAGVRNIRIENNRFSNFSPVTATGSKADGTWKDGDHPDVIQFWTTAETPTNSDVVIRGNKVEGTTRVVQFSIFELYSRCPEWPGWLIGVSPKCRS